MAGIADMVEAEPAYYNENFWVVSGTSWEIPIHSATDSNGALIPWTNCTAIAKLRRGDDTVAKTITHVLTGGLQIDLSTTGRLSLKGTPAATFDATDLDTPLQFNLQITCSSPSVVVIPMQRCFLIPQANLNN